MYGKLPCMASINYFGFVTYTTFYWLHQYSLRLLVLKSSMGKVHCLITQQISDNIVICGQKSFAISSPDGGSISSSGAKEIRRGETSERYWNEIQSRKSKEKNNFGKLCDDDADGDGEASSWSQQSATDRDADGTRRDVAEQSVTGFEPVVAPVRHPLVPDSVRKKERSKFNSISDEVFVFF